MFGIAVLIGAVVGLVFAVKEANKAWGTGSAIMIGLGCGLLTLLIPFVGLIAGMAAFAGARNAYMRRIAAGDEPLAVDAGFGEGDPNNPYRAPGFSKSAPSESPSRE